MSGKPAIPSKNALRALRHLAYSSPTAVVGAAGALCGIVTVHCHHQQKVQRAQKILATKRKLHSISNGRGSARLASMFEAAERGEDFTLQSRRRARASQRRDYSTSVAERESEDAQPLKSLGSNGGYHVGHANSETSEEQAEGADSSADTEWRPFIDAIRSWSTKSSSVNASTPLDASVTTLNENQQASKSLLQHEQFDRSPYLHKRTRARYENKRIPEEALDILNTPRRWGATNVSTVSRAPQKATDLHPFEWVAAHTAAKRWAMYRAKNKHTNSIVLDFDDVTSTASNSFNNLQPWQATSPKDTIFEGQPAEQNLQESRTVQPNLYIAKDAVIPHVICKHPFHSRYGLADGNVIHGMRLIGLRRYYWVFNTLMNHQQRWGQESALVLLERTMHAYAATGKRHDLILAQVLFIDCIRRFPSIEIKMLVYRFVQNLLRGDLPRLEVVSFLYPFCGIQLAEVDEAYYYPAQRYLEIIRDDGTYDLNAQVNELRKVLSGTRLCEIDLDEHLVVPVLRALCTAGRMTAAQALFDEMVDLYKIKMTFYSLQELVRGYAKAGNWSKVKSILDDCHAQGLAQSNVYGVSGLVISIVNDYGASHSPERTVQWVLHSVEQYGVQPVGGITRGVIKQCLRHRRYDLVVTWLDMMRERYPYVYSGTEQSVFGYEISCVWKEINASCEDILQTCRALASGALYDPFSRVFRSVIAEAVTSYLIPRLRELREEFGLDVPAVPRGSVDNFCSSIERAKQKFMTKPHNSGARLLMTDIMHQAKALRLLNALCRGDLRSRETGSMIIHPPNLEGENITQITHRLDSLREIKDAVMKQYAMQEKSGQDIDHTHLKEVVAQLEREDRRPHAIELVHSVYESRWVQGLRGVDFDLEIFTQWLSLAWRMKARSRLIFALWAIVDTGPHLKLSSQIILLARIAAAKSSDSKFKYAKQKDVGELEYLRLRLRRRHWSANETRQGLVFDEWHGFGDYAGHYRPDSIV